MCKAWGTLPEAGGLLDQPYKRMMTMSAALNIYNAWRAYTDKMESDAEWSMRHPDLWRIVVETEQMLNESG